MSGRYFIDTNIVVYAHITNDSQKHDDAMNLLRSHLTGSRLWISTQILNEFYSAMSKNRYGHADIVAFMKAIMQNMNTIAVSSETVENALYIRGKYQFSYWDSLVLSAALESNCEAVYTEDLQHNQVIEDRLTIINPFIVEKAK